MTDDSTRPATDTPVSAPGKAKTEERRLRFGRFWEHWAPRATSDVPPLLADRPEFRRLRAERAAVDAAEARIQVARRQLDDRNQEREERFKEAQAAALTDPTGTPPPPLTLEPWPYADRYSDEFDEMRRGIAAEERAILAERADEWRARIEEAMQPALRATSSALAVYEAAQRAEKPYRDALLELDRLAPQRGDDEPELTPEAAEVAEHEHMDARIRAERIAREHRLKVETELAQLHQRSRRGRR